ncbi:hypothetical protein Tco_0092887 [Tanacetum coccineum]
METKDTLSSCSNSEEQQMQQIQDKAKESCMHKHSNDCWGMKDRFQTTEDKVEYGKSSGCIDFRVNTKQWDRIQRAGYEQQIRNDHMLMMQYKPIYDESQWYSSNDMVHNHYLEEAKKKTQESSRNSRPSVMPSARSQSTANGSKPKPRINNQNL